MIPEQEEEGRILGGTCLGWRSENTAIGRPPPRSDSRARRRRWAKGEGIRGQLEPWGTVSPRGARLEGERVWSANPPLEPGALHDSGTVAQVPSVRLQKMVRASRRESYHAPFAPFALRDASARTLTEFEPAVLLAVGTCVRCRDHAPNHDPRCGSRRCSTELWWRGQGGYGAVRQLVLGV